MQYLVCFSHSLGRGPLSALCVHQEAGYEMLREPPPPTWSSRLSRDQRAPLSLSVTPHGG